ncbi:hypothetical protein [Halomonas denitrificans]|uniref:hypothetical protein n=1 Tax=Halomonas denitrificans TaxID=370769 RepID=UPI001C99D260|nr:hypothetical protein [Halomonas denitrificans]MBY5969542.1 hypothetical protein [Halomonas denitrificans]
MLNAFRSEGVIVDLVTGDSSQRKQCIDTVSALIESGVKYDFVYSESSTMPTALTDANHFPSRPFLDFNFFRYCQKSNIPVGLFYRDIYWRFKNYGTDLNFIKLYFAKLFYWYDILCYSKFVDRIYLPTISMSKYVPCIKKNKFNSLPPGHDNYEPQVVSNANFDTNNPLKLFYVGGLSDHYKMHVLFKVVSRREDIRLVVCTRKQEWEKVRSEYLEFVNDIDIVHEHGDEMLALMAEADIVSTYVLPQDYWEFAAPVKLYEYIGMSKPILASQGTYAGDFVNKHGIGWAVNYDVQELDRFFDSFKHSPQKIIEAKVKVEDIRMEHTWRSRARQVIEELTQ